MSLVSRRLPQEWRVPVAFVALGVGTLVYEVSHRSFWQHAHDSAPIAGALDLVLLALLLRRSRIAWGIFVAFAGLGLLSWAIHPARHARSVSWMAGLGLGVIEFGLLVSPPMRRFVNSRGKLEPG